MIEISIARIDDRLIHGQVVTQWIKVNPVEKIVIVDEALSKNKLMLRIYKAAAPAGIDFQVMNVDEVIEYLHGDGSEKILLLGKTPDVFLELINNGIVFKQIILGGMGVKEGRKRINRNISMSEQDINSFINIINSGTEVIYQMVPGDRKVNVESWLKEEK